MEYNTKVAARVLALGIITPKNRHVDQKEYFEEFLNLLRSNNITPVKTHFITLRTIDSGVFLTKGKLEELHALCKEHEIEEVIFSEALTPHQESELEHHLDLTVFDKTHLILEIFENRARSAEAKLQTKIAFLEFRKTRVAGKGKHFSQQGAGIGTRGPGQTQKEIDLEHIAHLLIKLTKDLKQLKKVRDNQRKNRIRTKQYIISLVGYTNAGKTTLFNTMTKSENYVEDLLFATLDTTTREMMLEGEKLLVSDTVGFIQNLPHNLIEAFQSTLEEILYANLILHVVDISNTNWKQQIQTVNQVLDDMDVDFKKVVYVFNKIDKISSDKFKELEWQLPEGPRVFITAQTKEGIKPLLEFIVHHLVGV